MQCILNSEIYIICRCTNLFLVGDDLKEVSETMSFELDKLSRWFQANKLSLNISKTNFMIFSNKKCDDNPGC